MRFGAVHLLEQRRSAEGVRWVPIAEAPLGRPIVVGQGGLALELTPGRVLDPEALAMLAADHDEEPAPMPVPAGAGPLAVVARREGEVVAVAQGWVAGPAHELETVRLSATAARSPDAPDLEQHLRSAWFAAAETAVDRRRGGAATELGVRTPGIRPQRCPKCWWGGAGGGVGRWAVGEGGGVGAGCQISYWTAARSTTMGCTSSAMSRRWVGSST